MVVKSLEEFKNITQRFHSSYHLVNIGLTELSKNILKNHGKEENDNFVVKGTNNEIISAIPYFHILKGLQDEGPISQIVAHGILNWVYTTWNDKYRKLIAVELGVDVNSVMCDVMGDLRMLRNAISHDFGFIDSDIKKLKELIWFSAGRIILNIEDMDKIQIKINCMQVYVKNT